MKKKITIKEIAKILMVSVSTVSKAMNDSPEISEKTKKKVKELAKFKDRLPEKFKYLAEAPKEDDDGNDAIVRFSRKHKEQYVVTEIKKKQTGWKAFYRSGKWQVEEK